MPDKSASVVIPLYNGQDFIGACLRSVLAQTASCHVVVVDDASTDESAALVARDFPQVTLLRNPLNLGYSRTVNIGWKHALAANPLLTAGGLFLLNQDTVLDPECVAHLLAACEANPNIGVAGCKIHYPDGKTIQHGGGWLKRPSAFGEHFGWHEEDIGQCDTPREVEFVTGAALFITQKAAQVLGGLDETLSPAYYEDADVCFRARAAGFGVWVVPQAKLTHREGSAFSGQFYRMSLNFHTGRVAFALRHWPASELLALANTEREQITRENSIDLALARSRAYLKNITGLMHNRARREAIYQNAPDMRVSTLEWEGVVRELLLTRETALNNALALIRENGTLQENAAMLKLIPAHVAPEVTTPIVARALDSLAAQLETNAERWTLQPFEFKSDVPLVGGLVSAVRRAWHNVSGRWALEHVMTQQSQMNRELAGAVRALADGANARLAALDTHRQAQANASAQLGAAVSVMIQNDEQMAKHINVLGEQKLNGAHTLDVLAQEVTRHENDLIEAALGKL